MPPGRTTVIVASGTSPVWVLTSFLPVDDATLATLHEAFTARWNKVAPGDTLNWVFQCRHESQTETRLMAGTVPEPHVVSERGARYRVHVLKGQNHGLFLDMAEGRKYWFQIARGQAAINGRELKAGDALGLENETGKAEIKALEDLELLAFELPH